LLWIARGDSHGFVLEFMLRLESVGRLRNFQVLQGKLDTQLWLAVAIRDCYVMKSFSSPDTGDEIIGR